MNEKMKNNVQSRKAVLKTLMHRWHSGDFVECWCRYSPKTPSHAMELKEYCRNEFKNGPYSYKHALHLGYLGDKESIPSIRDLLNEANTGCRKLGRASLALAFLNDVESIPRIREIAKDTDKPFDIDGSEIDYGIGYNSSHAFLALSYFGDRELVPLARDLLDKRRDKSENSKGLSDGRLAIALGVWGDQDSIPILRERLDQDLEKKFIPKFSGNLCIALGLLNDIDSVQRIREIRKTKKFAQQCYCPPGHEPQSIVYKDAAFGLYLLGEEDYCSEDLIKDEVERRVSEVLMILQDWQNISDNNFGGESK